MTTTEHEGDTQVVCVHLPDQIKRKEGVLEDSFTVAELMYSLVEQSSQKLLWHEKGCITMCSSLKGIFLC